VIVPQAAPTRMSASERDAVSAAVQRVMESDRWILGPEVERFEAEFGTYLGFGEVVGVANGTDALTIAFTALDLAPGSGVLIAANEGGYAATACRLAGLVPIVMDVDEHSMLPSVACAEAAMSENVRAIVVTHLHGEGGDIRLLDEWRRERGLLLIEDCAQAAGARRAGAHVGGRGDAATFSFYPTKNLAAAGDAGAVVFADSEHARQARSLREYGWGDRFRVEIARGRNSRMGALHAAVLSARLPYLDARNAARRAISNRYRAAFDTRFARVHGDALTTVAHHSVVVTDHRDRLAQHLESRGIGTALHYPFLVSEMPGLRVPTPPSDAPVAASLRDRMLSLPCFPELEEEEVAHVVQAIGAWNVSLR
jgi:dTDP-4-amino-4,6-dideoxygalactose transaminase